MVPLVALVLLELLRLPVPPVCAAAVSCQYGCVACCDRSQALFVCASGVSAEACGPAAIVCPAAAALQGPGGGLHDAVIPFRLWSCCTLCTAFTGCALGMQAVGVLHPVYNIHRIAEQPGQHLEISSLLLDMVKLPDQRAQLMEEMIKTFVFAIPRVSRVYCCACMASAQRKHAG